MLRTLPLHRQVLKTSSPVTWFFFAPRQSSLETASVDGNCKTFLNGFHALNGCELGICLPQTGHVVQNFRAQLVPIFRPSANRQ